MGKTHSKTLAARHGRGTAWARHAMCELALSRLHKKRKEKLKTKMAVFCVTTVVDMTCCIGHVGIARFLGLVNKREFLHFDFTFSS
jgi:hypothetical protein